AAGSLIGLLIGVISFVAIFLLFRDIIVALIVSLSMTLVILVASPLAVGITAILAKKRDPALGAGPFGTIIQDITSLIVYFTVASVVLNFFG
ncbi:MAG: magnesium transporter, partial [bacterium]